MKKLAALIFAAALLAGCGQKKYDYTTFAWPEGTENATMIYWDMRGAQQTRTNMDLDSILDKAQDLGWEYAGSVGTTCIMRRPQRPVSTGLDMSGDFAVGVSKN